MSDLIDRESAICALISLIVPLEEYHDFNHGINDACVEIMKLSPAEPEIIRCGDCRHNRSCEIQYHAQAGDLFYCGAAERRTNEVQDNRRMESMVLH